MGWSGVGASVAKNKMEATAAKQQAAAAQQQAMAAQQAQQQTASQQQPAGQEDLTQKLQKLNNLKHQGLISWAAVSKREGGLVAKL